MVTSLISVQSKKIYSRQTPKIYSTRKQKVLFRNSNHLEKNWKSFWISFPRPRVALGLLIFGKVFQATFLIKMSRFFWIDSTQFLGKFSSNHFVYHFWKKSNHLKTYGKFFQDLKFSVDVHFFIDLSFGKSFQKIITKMHV